LRKIRNDIKKVHFYGLLEAVREKCDFEIGTTNAAEKLGLCIKWGLLKNSS